MSIFSNLFGKKKNDEGVDINARSAEEFMTLIRVYYQGVIAVNLGVTNMNVLPDLALFKRMLKIPTQGNKLGLAEKGRARKILIQDYTISESFFREIDASIKSNCRSQQQIQPYFFKFQGFCTDLFNMIDHVMSIGFRLSLFSKTALRKKTQKKVHEIMTRSEWKEVNQQKLAWSVRKYAESMGYSEIWVSEFVYSVLVLARKESRKESRKKNEE